MKPYAPEYYKQASVAEKKSLTSYDPRKFPVWVVTVDMVVLAVSEDLTEEPQVLLIKRGKYPFKGQWALPGGFIETDENPREAAIRELKEEAGLDVLEAVQIGAFGAVGRDPRGPSVSIAHLSVVGLIDGQPPEVYAGDDAVEAQWFKVTEVPNLELAFDHIRMIEVVSKPEVQE